MIVLGIDPGKDGALVTLDAGRLAGAWLTDDLTVAAGRASARREYCPEAMAAVLVEAHPDLVVLERQQAFPGQGGSSNYSTGYGYGLWRGILAALHAPVLLVLPQGWQKVMLLGQPGEGKERSVLACRALLPDLNLTPGRRRKPHDGLSDAGLLALYGIRVQGRAP